MAPYGQPRPVAAAAPAPTTTADAPAPSFSLFSGNRSVPPEKLKVKAGEMAVFLRQLAVILQTGIPLAQGLTLLGENLQNPQFRQAILQISDRLSSGTELSTALSAYPKTFKPIMVGLIKAGEFGGILDQVVERLAALVEEQQKLKGQIIGALTYPAIMLVIALSVALGLLIGIVPRFAQMFADLNAELPMITQVMLALSKAVINPLAWAAVVGLGVAGGWLFQRYYATASGRLQVDTWIFKVPLFGDLILKTEVASFCDTLSTLVAAGIPAVEGLSISIGASNNMVIRNTLRYTIQRAEQGEAISQAIASRRTLPRLVPAMLRIGEETGEFSLMLEKLALFYSREVENAVRTITKAMEPAIVMVVSVIVGTIVISLYLPMFALINAMRG